MSHHKLHWAKPESEANYKTSCVDSVNSPMWKTLLDKTLLNIYQHIISFQTFVFFMIVICNTENETIS